MESDSKQGGGCVDSHQVNLWFREAAELASNGGVGNRAQEHDDHPP
jgi:hypothetical protein